MLSKRFPEFCESFCESGQLLNLRMGSRDPPSPIYSQSIRCISDNLECAMVSEVGGSLAGLSPESDCTLSGEFVAELS